MDSILLNAIIGGLFSLIGIYVKHRFDKKNEITATSNVENRDAAQYKSKSFSEKFFNRDFNTGLAILLLDFIGIAIVVGVFDLNNTEPAWENFFAMVVIGAVPVLAIFYMLKGFVKYFVD